VTSRMVERLPSDGCAAAGLPTGRFSPTLSGESSAIFEEVLRESGRLFTLSCSVRILCSISTPSQCIWHPATGMECDVKPAAVCGCWNRHPGGRRRQKRGGSRRLTSIPGVCTVLIPLRTHSLQSQTTEARISHELRRARRALNMAPTHES
jgi:hypothetical protein